MLKEASPEERTRVWRWAGVFAVAFLAVALPALAETDMSPEWIAATLLLGGCLVALAAIDAVTFRLPDVLTLLLLGAGLLGWAFMEADIPYAALISAVAGGLALFGAGWLYRWARGREGLGLGDVKLFAAAGAWLGIEGLPSVLLVACLAALAAVGYGLMRGKKLTGGSAIPFGPFLAIGFWTIWIYGPLA